MGTTISPSQTPASFAWSNGSNTATFSRQRTGRCWDAGNSNAGYDRAAINYVWWARTGESDLSQSRQRDHRGVSRQLPGSGRLLNVTALRNHGEGLYLDWLIIGRNTIQTQFFASQTCASRSIRFSTPCKDSLDDRRARTAVLLDGRNRRIESHRPPDSTPRFRGSSHHRKADGHWGFEHATARGTL